MSSKVTHPKWTAPVRDPSFAVYLHDVLAYGASGLDPEPYEFGSKLSDHTGFTVDELIVVLGVPAGHFNDEDGARCDAYD